MERCGAQLPAAEFIRTVSNAYHQLQAPVYDEIMAGFHNEILAVLASFLSELHLPERGLRALDLGCGTGFASRALLQQWGPRVQQLLCSDISPHMLELCRKKLGNNPVVSFELKDIAAIASGAAYDLVLTCSVVHHIAAPPEFFAHLARLVCPGGYYLMLHEPSRRFYQNAECLQLSERYRKAVERRRLLRYLNPAAYLRKLRQILTGQSVPLEVQLNRLLIASRVIQSPLTRQEIGRLVDIHDPLVEPDALGLGQNGFLLDELASGLLSHFRLVTFKSYAFLGDLDTTSAPAKWREKARRLAARDPDDGASFCAAWQKVSPG